MGAAEKMLHEIVSGLDGLDPQAEVHLPAGGSLPSAFAVSDLAQASIGAAGAALATYMGLAAGVEAPPVTVERDLASAWFAMSVRPLGWSPPPVWDAIAGDYAGADGWIRLHTNAVHHRRAALSVLGDAAERAEVAELVARWPVDDLEEAVVGAGGAAAAMHSLEEWADHPQGRATNREPLLLKERTNTAPPSPGGETVAGRPLAGIRVLDLTRVLAGPVATRLLAGFGADVLRIDPPDWDEPSIAPEVTVGKHCARLDASSESGRRHLMELLSSADIIVHGYRRDALERLGIGAQVRQHLRPGLVDVSLDAYGWSGPWAARRGFDSLVQMSTGIADAGRKAARSDRPVPLPVQALDHATGYIMAAAALSGLSIRHRDGVGTRWRASLARTAHLLVSSAGGDQRSPVGIAVPEADGPTEHTAWGPARRLAPPLSVAGASLRWDLPARPLGSDPAEWADTSGRHR